jgi:putative transposase
LHILIKLHPSIALSTFVKELKAYSSSWMKKTMVPDFGWQNGYGAFSYSKSMLPSVSKYIENQKEHHKTQTFKDEINLLKSQWGIEWNFD